MKKSFITMFIVSTVITLLPWTGSVGAADKQDQVTVAYFLEWPTANQVAQVEQLYDKAMGVKVKWVAFPNGNEMTRAMKAGDVQIAYSQGLIPYVVAVSAGVPLQLVGIAVSYSENDNCVVHRDAGVSKYNAHHTLVGKTIATPIGNVTHYKLLRTLDYLGVDVSKVKIVKMDGAPGAAALTKHRVDMACAFGGPLTRMKDVGHVLMTGKEQEEFGLLTFDVISTTKEFAENHPDLLTKFMQVTEDANRAYAKDPAHAQPIIAKAAGMKLADSNSFLDKFSFLSKEEQLSEAWFGGTVQAFCKGAADFFVKQKVIPKALDDYSPYVDDSFLKKVK
ncbi:MAG TPA: ABC transporter substrate-binding protein [Desulfobacterales bacterium]|jgi:taurine transport system substrate-binding protein|nr:ABC transporter substrate-binding protein [Desulfobacterales bacterium]